MLEYVFKGEQLKVNSKNIIDYLELCKDFKQSIDDIESENVQNIYKEAVINYLISNKNNNYNKQLHEEFISKNLYEFLNKYWNIMKKIEITSLYNIFFSKNRQLSDEKIAYRFITENPSENTLSILLPSLDGNNLDSKLCEESILKKDERFGFIPQNCTSFITSQNKSMTKTISDLQDKQKNDEIEIEKLQKGIEQIKNENKELKNQIEKLKNTDFSPYFNKMIICPEKTEKGILEQLKANIEINPHIKFDPPFIASQSSNDIYNVINPYSKDSFFYVVAKDSKIETFIQFEFENPIIINGIEFHSEVDVPLKNFSIQFDDKSTERKIIDAKKEFDEKDINKRVKKITFDPIEFKKLKIIPINKDISFVHNEYYPSIKYIELLSPDSKYSNGYFKTLINENPNHDPHKIGVNISATRYDYNNFHLHDKDYPNITTKNIENSWFQIELVKGLGIICAFRLKAVQNYTPIHYKIVAIDEIVATDDTDDAEKVIKKWHLLYEGNEKISDQWINIQLPHKSPPVKFVRLIQLEKNQSSHKLKLIHFDIFGYYFEEKI